MSYDQQCEELARHFLEGVTGEDPEPGETSALAQHKKVTALAQHIQDAVEDWFSDQARKKEG
jgi:hypothetical protein